MIVEREIHATLLDKHCTTRKTVSCVYRREDCITGGLLEGVRGEEPAHVSNGVSQGQALYVTQLGTVINPSTGRYSNTRQLNTASVIDSTEHFGGKQRPLALMWQEMCHLATRNALMWPAIGFHRSVRLSRTWKSFIIWKLLCTYHLLHQTETRSL